MKIPVEKFSPHFRAGSYSDKDRWHLEPFFTNIDKPAYAALIFSPELIGALCSRTSRASEDLREIYLREYIYPFVEPVREKNDTDEDWKTKVKYGKNLLNFIEFLHKHPILQLFSNPRARTFYAKWLAQYGDDSIAQMAGMHLVYSGISQVAIKHVEDQRIGIAPIEKSTRYVDYGKKVGGKYLYYTDPTFELMGLKDDYERAMDGLFENYSVLIPKLSDWLGKKFPEEKPTVVKKKAFDTLRGLLPTSALSMVAFFGNGQAFEYLAARSLRHPLGEIRWIGESAKEELAKIAPSFFRRIMDPDRKEIAEDYQKFLAEKWERVAPAAEEVFSGELLTPSSEPAVRVVQYDPEGEFKILTGILYSAPNNHRKWDEILERVKKMSENERRALFGKYLEGRKARWQKVGRAFENAYVRWEIEMNIGAWRDVHRHRLLTQQRQHFTCEHGYDVPPEIVESGLEPEFRSAVDGVQETYRRIAEKDRNLAQYAVTLAHRLRFMQWENLRQTFWQTELRSIPEGHPDYRKVMQEKFRHLEKIYPLIAERMLVNMGDYDFARRGQEEKIQEKAKKLGV